MKTYFLIESANSSGNTNKQMGMAGQKSTGKRIMGKLATNNKSAALRSNKTFKEDASVSGGGTPSR